MEIKKTLIDDIVSHPDQFIVWYFYFNSLPPRDALGFTTRPIIFLRKQDYICCPDSPETRNVWQWAKKMFNYSDNQILWTRFTNELLPPSDNELVFKTFADQKNALIVPYTVDPDLVEYSIKYNVEIYGDDSYLCPDKRWPYLPYLLPNIQLTFLV